MCGIVGIIDTARGAIDRDVVCRMTRAVAHRGPDDEGLWFDHGVGFGHRRLSIIDLTSTGHQPMESPDGSLCITYNGEVYNAGSIRQELVAKGYHFKGRSDTEVVLRAFECWGEECLHRFNGMFAFAIWDSRQRKLFAARDRFGVKPFYYFYDGKTFVFASEIKALLQCALVSRRPNLERLFDYLVSGKLDEPPETFFDGILQLPASSALWLEPPALRVWTYYQIEPDRRSVGRNEGEACDRFRELLADSVALRFTSDVPVASTLSGGLDSSSVVSMAVRYLRERQEDLPHKVFTACFDNATEDERPFVRIAAGDLPLECHDVVVRADSLMETIEEQIVRQDQPVMSAAMFAKGEVMRLVSSHGIKVVLEGQGVDEWCCGYPAAAIPAIADDLCEARLCSALKHFYTYIRKYRASPGRVAESVTDLAFPRTKALLRSIKRFRKPSRDASPASWLSREFNVRKVSLVNGRWARGALDDYCLRAMFENHLPFYLRSDDHNAMAFSVEARHPFLDYRLIEFVFSLPREFRIRDGTSKWILRESMRGIVPEPLRTYPGKRAFPTPQAEWLSAGPWDEIEAVLRSKAFRGRGIFDGEASLSLFQDFCNGRRELHQIVWRMLNAEIWLRCFNL